MSSTIKMTGTTKLSEYLYDVKIAIFNLGFTKRAPYLMIDLGCTNQDYHLWYKRYFFQEVKNNQKSVTVITPRFGDIYIFFWD